ncbi:MAG: helix-turn-helix transcriptional regulator [Hydrogeniiclostridium mannosilyticum]
MFHLQQDEFCVNGMLNMPARYSFPFDYCSGLSLVLDKNSMTEVTRSQLALFQIDISVLEEDLDTAHQWYICKTPPSMCHVFEELYAAKEHETSQYFRIKVLELLYHATKLRKEDRVAATYYAREHIEIVKRVRKAMLKDLSRSTPLEQFLRGEAISTVTFQTIFKQIYGRSPYAYLKHYRMNSAAVQLRESNESINQIALSLGYSNASKFARAFRDVFGVLPKDYRTAQKAI